MEHAEYDSMHALEDTLWWYRALHAIVLSRIARLKLPANARVLDAGCGTGGMLQQLRLALPSATLNGIDFNPHAAALASTKSGVTAIIGTLHTLPFPDNYFDAIVSLDVLYHRNINSELALAECLRCLKPGGHLLLNLPAYNWMKSAHDEHIHTRERFTVSSLKKLLTNAGLIVTDAGYWNSLLFPLMALSRLTVGKHRQHSDVEHMSPWLDALFFRVASYENFLQQHGIRLPFGGSVWAHATKP